MQLDKKSQLAAGEEQEQVTNINERPADWDKQD
jgi:hypothetical protein